MATEKEKLEWLEKLADVLSQLGQKIGMTDKPIVRVDDCPTILWEGIYDWTCITLGCNLFAGEFGNYSMEPQPELYKILRDIEGAGIFLEPINHYSIGAYDA